MANSAIRKLPYHFSLHTGVAFIGKYLQRVQVNAPIGREFPVRYGVANTEALKSDLALPYLDKSAMGLNTGASSPTLRQAMDVHAVSWFEPALQMRRLFLGSPIYADLDDPPRNAGKRRRIKTVMQERMFKAARGVRHAGRWVLGLGESDRGFAVFERHQGQPRGQLRTGQLCTR